MNDIHAPVRMTVTRIVQMAQLLIREYRKESDKHSRSWSDHFTPEERTAFFNRRDDLRDSARELRDFADDYLRGRHDGLTHKLSERLHQCGRLWWETFSLLRPRSPEEIPIFEVETLWDSIGGIREVNWNPSTSTTEYDEDVGPRGETPDEPLASNPTRELLARTADGSRTPPVVTMTEAVARFSVSSRRDDGRYRGWDWS